MDMTTIQAAEIQSITVLDQSKNRVLIVRQRTGTVVVKSEEGRGRDNVGAMLEFHASVFSKLRSLPFKTERVTLTEIEELMNCAPSKVSGTPTKDVWQALLRDHVLNMGGQRKSVIKVSLVEELADLKKLVETHDKMIMLCKLLSGGGGERRRSCSPRWGRSSRSTSSSATATGSRIKTRRRRTLVARSKAIRTSSSS